MSGHEKLHSLATVVKARILKKRKFRTHTLITLRDIVVNNGRICVMCDTYKLYI